MSKLSQFKQSQDTDFPIIRPNLDLRFALTKRLDPRITFTRGSTGTYIGPDGMMRTAGVNQPRFDHDPITGKSLGLLIEESRTNYVFNSQTLYSDASPPGNIYMKPDTTLSYVDYASGGPNGGAFTRITRVTPRNSPFPNDWDWLWRYGSDGQNAFPNGTVFVFSCYARSIDGSVKTIKFSNPDSGAVLNSLTTSWRRVYGLFTAGSGSIGWFRINRSNPDTFAVGSNYDIANLQAEIGTFPTSYIPTSASTVTRSADLASMTGTNFSSWYNQTEGSILVDCSNPEVSTTLCSVSLNDTITDRIQLESGINARAVRNVYNGVTQISSLSYSYNTRQKFIVSYNSINKILNFSNSGSLGTQINSQGISTMNVLRIGASPAGSNPLNSSIARLTYYPIQLTNQQLINLTS